MFTEQELKRKLLSDINELRDKKGFLQAGLPYFDRLFGRDSLISAWQLLDTDPDICRKTLMILAEYQGKDLNDESEEEPGKILHETMAGAKRHPAGFFPFPYYGSVDSTALFIIVFYFYFKKTRDHQFLKQYWQNILSAVNWMEQYGDKDKDYFLEYERKNPKGLFHQGWRDGFENHLSVEPPVAIVEAQGYQYFALKIAQFFAEELKDVSLKDGPGKRAENLKRKFNESFWVQGEKYFALALDGKKLQRRAITSNPGHLLFCGIINKDKEKFVVSRLFGNELWTPFGVRTHSIKEPDFDAFSYHLGSVWPHDNWIIAQGLKKQGYRNEYEKIKNGLLAAYKEIGSIPEFYGVSPAGKIILKDLKKMPCSPQAWSSGALLNFLSSED